MTPLPTTTTTTTTTRPLTLRGATGVPPAGVEGDPRRDNRWRADSPFVTVKRERGDENEPGVDTRDSFRVDMRGVNGLCFAAGERDSFASNPTPNCLWRSATAFCWAASFASRSISAMVARLARLAKCLIWSALRTLEPGDPLPAGTLTEPASLRATEPLRERPACDGEPRAASASNILAMEGRAEPFCSPASPPSSSSDTGASCLSASRRAASLAAIASASACTLPCTSKNRVAADVAAKMG